MNRASDDSIGQRPVATERWAAMRRAAAALVLMLMAGLMAAPAHAADISVSGREDLPVINISGEIRRGDDIQFQRIAARHRRAIVLLSGPGGQLVTALAIGRDIHERRFSTVAAPGTCSSACALIWLAGSRRAAFSTARIGFHAGYRGDTGVPIADGVANAMIGRYMTQLNLPEAALIFATSADPQDMAWLNLSQPGAHGISFDVIPDPDAPATPSTPAAGIQARAAPGRAAPDRSAPLPRIIPGQWGLMSRDNVYGVSTASVDRPDALLMYACTEPATCLLGLTLRAQCAPGDRYTIDIVFDEVSRPVNSECDERGRILYLDEPLTLFATMLRARTMTVIIEGERSGTNRIPFTLDGLPARWREAQPR
jgi:hypothetical protein